MTTDRSYGPTKHDIEFIRDVYSFGWYTRRVTALALYEQIVNCEALHDPARPQNFQPIVEVDRCRWILRARIFAEFVSSLEVFGTLCMAIRQRNKRSIIWTFMNTEPQEVTQLYKALQSSPPKSLSQFLKIRGIGQTRKAMQKRDGAEYAEISEATYGEILSSIRLVADMYLGIDSVLVRAYNKLKHTIPLLDTDYFNKGRGPDELGILVEDEKILSGQFGALPLSIAQENVDVEIQGIATVSEIGAEIMALTLELDALGMLGT